jgi:hypothetical protein
MFVPASDIPYGAMGDLFDGRHTMNKSPAPDQVPSHDQPHSDRHVIATGIYIVHLYLSSAMHLYSLN